jgi:hypothetical protein
MMTWGQFYRKWRLESVPNGGTSSNVVPSTRVTMVEDVLVINFFCPFEVSRKLHSDQSQNFESWHLLEVLQNPKISKTTSLCLLR